MKDVNSKNQKKYMNKTIEAVPICEKGDTAVYHRYGFSDHCQPKLLFLPGLFFPGRR